MLLINGENAEILRAYFEIAKKEFEEEYYGNLSIEFQLHNKKGYFQFFVDSPGNDNLNYYSNKFYKCIPELDEKSINDLEIYDTNNHYSLGDFENEMIVSFGIMKNNKITVKILISEKYLLIDFEDIVDIINEHVNYFGGIN